MVWKRISLEFDFERWVSKMKRGIGIEYSSS